MKLLRVIIMPVVAISIFQGTAANSQRPVTPVLSRWNAVAPKIQEMLKGQQTSCEPERIRAGPIDAVEFDRRSFALIDVCPLGAYTELIDAMELRDNNPVPARFRKHGKQLDLEFSRGASVMHGKEVKLVPEQRAIYDISWDNDGQNDSGTVKLQSCTVQAYVWNAKSETFDFNPVLTKRETNRYCRELERKVH